jgi:hypothetical protein
MGENPGREILKTVWRRNKGELDDAWKCCRSSNGQNIEKAVISKLVFCV